MPDLDLLWDRLQIDDLLTAYTMAIDQHAWDRLDDVFTPDAHLDYTASGGIEGPFPEVKAWMAKMLPMFTGMQHFVTQKQVRVEGDAAHVRAYFYNPLVMERPDREPFRMEIGGVYVHTLVRTPEGWRSRRLVEEMLWERTEQ